MSNKCQTIAFAVLLTATLCLGLFWRIQGIHRSLEYDEIWPTQKFAKNSVWEILLSQKLSNNYHPIAHTIAGMYPPKGPGYEFEYRKWHLLAGFLLLVVVALYTFEITTSYECCILATAFCAFDPHLIHYSQTARGYALQHLCTILLCYTLFRDSETMRQKSLIPWAFIVVVALLCLQFSVVTSILIWVPLVVVFIVRQALVFKASKISRGHFAKTLVPIVLAGLLICAWFLVVYKDLLKGTGDRVPYDSWWLLPSDVIGPLLWFPLHILWILGLCWGWRSRFFWPAISLLITAISFVLLTRLLGPVRVYTYLLPFLYIAIAFALHKMLQLVHRSNRFINTGIFIATLLVVAIPSQLTLKKKLDILEGPDYKTVMPEIIERAKQDYLLFPTWDGLLVDYYYPAINVVNSTKLSRQSNLGSLSVVIINHEQRPLELPLYDVGKQKIAMCPLTKESVLEHLNIAGISSYRISAHRIDTVPSDPIGILLAVVIIYDGNQYKQTFDLISQQAVWHNANFLFTRPVHVPDERGIPKRIVGYLLCTSIQSSQDWHQATSLLPNASYYWLPQ